MSVLINSRFVIKFYVCTYHLYIAYILYVLLVSNYKMYIQWIINLLLVTHEWISYHDHFCSVKVEGSYLYTFTKVKKKYNKRKFCPSQFRLFIKAGSSILYAFLSIIFDHQRLLKTACNKKNVYFSRGE